MAQTYAQIQEQIAKLQSDAEALRTNEIAGVVARIKEAIATYDLTAQDLFGRQAAAGKRKTAGKSATVAAKYSDGKGGEWVGRGKRPQWLRDALAAGKNLEDFAVGASSRSSSTDAEAAPARAKPGKKAASKKSAKAKFSDGTNSWSGFGRKPRWLVDALAAGKTLEDFQG